MATQSRQPIAHGIAHGAILLTRPLPQSVRFAAALTQRFGAALHIVISPLIAPVFFAGPVPNRPFTALILTSETGVVAAQRIMAQGATLPRRAYCVGHHTARCAADAGLDAVSAAGDATALVALIGAQNLSGPLLHICGRDMRGEVAARLISAGIETLEQVAYAQDPVELTAEAVAHLTGRGRVAVPLFSPRTATLLVAECARIGLTAPLSVIAMSRDVAEAAAPLPAKTRATALAPTGEAMLTAIAALLYPAPGS